MFKDKRPEKWILLGTLLLIGMIGLVLFSGMRAQAADKFLPIQDIKTPGGISVWLVEDHSLPVIAVNFMFLDSGAVHDPDDRQGLARMLSNTMDEGAGDLDSQNFQKMLSDSSISLTFSGSRDGFGGNLKTLTRNKDKAFELLALAMNSPRFDDEAVARMRDGNLARIKSSLSEPEWMAARLLNDCAYEGHPYSKNSGGTLSSLGRITPDDLRAFKNKYLTQDSLVIAVSGDITPAQLGPAIDAAFGKLPATKPVGAVKDTGITNPGEIYVYEQDIPQTRMEILIPAFDNEDEDFYALQILNYIYGGAGFGSRLMEEAREKRGLTYGIYSSLQDNLHNDSMSISTSTKNDSANEMLEIVKAEMIRLQNEPVTAKELEDAKSYIIGSMPLSLTSSDNIASMVLSMRVKKLPIDYLDTLAAKFDSVTAEDIQRVAKRVLKPESMVTIMVGKPEMIENSVKVTELPNVQ